ncbi:hypothetical protein [Pseudomonas sp. GD03944]|uniref:hypothetical protein n=1 Tax=Pseudomonas sp. GD03944 TaxID=2975409 RepID=UPI002449B603|nr:hypothetical protein [Pseudomonas sp. GD03944]MDH1263868.1 hypothetical protein [Pseudomonas sp. GD03944]
MNTAAEIAYMPIRHYGLREFAWRLLLLFLPTVSGCSAQPKKVFVANFENACSYPVEVSAHKYSNGKLPFAATQTAAAGEPLEVLSHINFGSTLDASLLNDYRLEIKAHDKSISLDKEHFLTQLSRSSAEKRGNAIATWTIHDTTLCP